MKKKQEKKQKKISFMDAALVLMAVAAVVFTLKMIQLYELTGAIPDTLVQCVFTALTGEAGFMAVIMRQKIKERSQNKEQNQKEPEPDPEGAGDVSND